LPLRSNPRAIAAAKSILHIENGMNNSTLIPALAVVATMLVNGCSGDAKKGAVGAGAPVLVAPAVETNVPVQINPPPVGHVMPYSTVTIRPQVGGVISQVHFQQGQEVKKGDLLFTIDPRPMQAALDAARAALARDQAQSENARIQFGREQKLFEQKLISQDEFDTSKAGLDALVGTVAADQAAVTNAMLNLDYCQIRAPIDGVTGSLQFYQGNVVKAPDDTLLTINQIHPIYVAFAVPEQYLPEIKKEMRERTLKAQATFQNMDVPPPEGELTFIDNAVDTTTGTIQLKATFPNEDSTLWPGQFVQVVLTLSDLTNAIVVPTQAVQTGQNGRFVYVVKPDQTAEERPVIVDLTYQGETVVQSGLRTGETVVTDGQLRLAPGVKINIKSAISSTNAPGTVSTNTP
jgi:multidrug efflux system membrane fusion protein